MTHIRQDSFDHTPSLRFQSGRLSLSERAARGLAKRFPHPWTVWAVGAFVTWSVLWLTYLAGSLFYPQYGAACDYVSGYVTLMFAAGALVGFVGALFQVIALLRTRGSVHLLSILALVAAWGLTFVVLDVGCVFMADIDPRFWIPCVEGSVPGDIGYNLALMVINLMPLVGQFGVSIVITGVVWVLERRNTQRTNRVE